MRLHGKGAVVTGASRGIGGAIARRLASDGASVIVNYCSNEEAALRVVHEIMGAGGTAYAVQADVSRTDEAHRLFEQAIGCLGRLDILVNNAGYAEFLPLDRITEAHVRRHVDTNFTGVVSAIQEAARRFGSEGGRIVNITSGAAQATPPGASIYSATKAAVEALTKTYAAELGPRGITVNAVAPGLTVTDMLNAVMPHEVQQSLISQTPLRRLGAPEDIADVVAFLASDDARWVTGQIVAASGGFR